MSIETSGEVKRAGRLHVLRPVGGSAAARMLVLPISAILGIFVTRLIIDNYGQASYAQYMLLVGIAALIPFADLGISASIMNSVAAADDPRSDAMCAAHSSPACAFLRDPRACSFRSPSS